LSLRYGYVSNGLSDHRLEHALELLAENGYSGVALTLDHIHFDPFAPRMRARAARLRSELDALGLDAVVETGARFVLDPRRKHFPTLVSDGRQKRVDATAWLVDSRAQSARSEDARSGLPTGRSMTARLVRPSRRPGPKASATSTPRRTMASGFRNGGSGPRCPAGGSRWC